MNSTSQVLYPEFSIITPSFNQGSYLEQTIDSVTNQNKINLEYIIIDGGSTDNSLDIIKNSSHKIDYWISEIDSGQSNAINKGLLIAKGNIINWLNSDDFYYPCALYHIKRCFQDSSVNVYTGRSRIFSAKNEFYSKGTDIYIDNLEKTIGWARVDQPETFFRKSVFDEIGPLNDCLHYVMDRDLWVRYLAKFGLSGIKRDHELIVNFRLHQHSKTISNNSHFDQEHINLFYTYAVWLGFNDVTQIFNLHYKVNYLPLKYFPEGLKFDEWRRIFNYFFFMEALKAYAINKHTFAKKIINIVEKKSFDSDDLKLYNRVAFRLRYLPLPFKRFWNIIKNINA
jgi:glycosyltransferase involved in cell wall biosynthesis